MSTIKYFANRVRETTVSNGTGTLVLTSTSGYKTVLNTIGQNKNFTYYIFRTDTNANFEWEIGVGHIVDNVGTVLLYRDSIISSSNNDNLVSFTTGTKYIEPIIGQDRVNSSFVNVSEQSGNFTADYIPATYVIDASSSNVQISLPSVSSYTDPVVLGFVLNKTIGDQYSQPNAIVIVPSGTETINGDASLDMSVRDDYLQIMSLPSQSGWVLLDPIQDSSNPYGNDGSIQVKYDNAFSGVPGFNWNFANNAFLIGGTGTVVTADIIMPSGSGSTIVFNEQSYSNDFRVEGSGNTHLLFVDGSENKIGISTSNAYDSLTINSQYGNGLTVYRSGVGPSVVIGNTSVSGNATNDIIGHINFSGLNSLNNPTKYSSIYSKIQDTTDSDESASLNMQIMKDGALEEAFSVGASGINIGFNNSNLDGIIIGEVSQNEGTNVVLGYYQNICGESCVAIGHNGTLASGTFGGLIGMDHSSSGNNIWVIGGSGVSVSGDNKTYLANDNNNYIIVNKSGSLDYVCLSSGNQYLNLYNSYALISGIEQNINFKFDNASDITKTGLIIGSKILDTTNSSEDTELSVKILGAGSSTEIVKINTDATIIGDNTVSGNNMVFGIDNTISGVNNTIVGSGISSSGINNLIFGNNISHSGTNTVIMGKDITCSTSGNVGITIFGRNNTADQDYVSVFGNSNSASGLYATAMGYLNGVHGEYSVGVGQSNLVIMDGSVAVGNSNSLSALSTESTAFSIGVGNTINISNTGLSCGYNNEIYGSGGLVFGVDIYSTGNNNLVIGNNVGVTGINNILIGNDLDISDSGVIQIYKDNNNYIKVSSSGTFIQSSTNYQFNKDIIVGGSGIFVSGIVSSGNISISSLPSVSGSSSISSVIYQDNTLKSNSIAYSGSLSSPTNLTHASSEYQFLYPSTTTQLYLPNGTGLYMGKKFTIANMDSTNSINVRKSGELSDFVTVPPLKNISIVHAGNNNWVRISYWDSMGVLATIDN